MVRERLGKGTSHYPQDYGPGEVGTGKRWCVGSIWVGHHRVTIGRLYFVKIDIFKNAFFCVFFIRNNLSMVDLIIKVVLEFLSNLYITSWSPVGFCLRPK